MRPCQVILRPSPSLPPPAHAWCVLMLAVYALVRQILTRGLPPPAALAADQAAGSASAPEGWYSGPERQRRWSVACRRRGGEHPGLWRR